VTDDVATRVARGVALLDEHKPGWVGLIDLPGFDISRTDRCILGQVYYVDKGDPMHASGFGRGTEELAIIDVEAEFGFDNYNEGDEFPELQKEWVRVIEVLRQQRIDKESSEGDQVLVQEAEYAHGG
jgi:hypothetical protein